MLFLVRLIVTSTLLSLAGSAVTCAWAGLLLVGKLQPCVMVAERPERSALVIARGDLGFEPQPVTLGQGGPPIGLRPLLHRYSHRGVGLYRGIRPSNHGRRTAR